MLLSAKKFDPLIAALCDRFGTDDAARIWVDAEQRLEGLIATTADLSDGERMHAEGFIYPMCALFLAIANRCGREEAKQICANFMRQTALAKGEALQKLLRAPGMRSVFMKLFGIMGRRLFGEKAGFEQHIHECTTRRLRMDILACPYLRHCTAAGAPEIAPLFCANDEYAYGNLPGITFQRSGTLANGAERCDFLLTRA
ncbi:MAG: L-2-amino-thiazoline-4-carboxylic acid hydrolase [Coriobacteriales bacterium]|nr:L-2-amino-thiazoline-4-carboxylic acid hydrolase [Coriobacteriales bacterium]